MFNLYQLNKLAKEYAMKYWGMELNCPVVINGRLTRALGYYKYWIKDNRPHRIELAKRLIENYNEVSIIEVLKHELTHWALHQQGKPFDDGHPVFEAEIIRVGSHSTKTLPKVGKLYQAVCSKCKGSRITRDKQHKIDRLTNGCWISSCCKVKFEYAGYSMVNDTYKGTRQTIAEVANLEKQPVVKEIKVEQPNVSSELIEIGPRGVTNKQMIPAIKRAIDKASKEDLQKLQQSYPEVFQGSLRYLPKKYMESYNSLARELQVV